MKQFSEVNKLGYSAEDQVNISSTVKLQPSEYL